MLVGGRNGKLRDSPEHERIADRGLKKNRQHPKALVLAVSIVLFVLFLGLRLAFVEEVLEQNGNNLHLEGELAGHTGFLTADSVSYIKPALEIMRGNWADSGSLSRPPGYPDRLGDSLEQRPVLAHGFFPSTNLRVTTSAITELWAMDLGRI